jgi:ADP-ribosyl-[dinitrogen reductase] hydrolase
MQEGYRSSIGRCFDIGGTTSNSIRKFLQTGEPYSGSTAEYDSGNGCIMRLAPVAIAYQFDEGKNLFYSGESSRVTHASIQCIESSKLFGNILRKALLGHEKRSILLESGGFEITSPKVRSLASAEYLTRSIDDIRGSGYVIECLEAALWCFAKTDSFEGAVLKATNLGDDADTTAAVCGQICGAYYGKDNIPLNWLDTLHLREEIESLASQLCSIFQDAS